MDSVTGASHADVVSERILQPLGLDATYYKNEPGYPTPPGLVNSYQDLAGDGRLMNVTDMTVHYTDMFMGNTGSAGERRGQRRYGNAVPLPVG